MTHYYYTDIGIEHHARLEQQLAALKDTIGALRYHQTTASSLAAQPMAGYVEWPAFAEVEHALAELQQTTSALYHHAKYYHNIVHTRIDPICRFDADFNLTFVNETLGALYKKPLPELLGTSLLALFPVTEQAAVTALLLGLTPAAPVASFESMLHLADAAPRWFGWTYQLLSDGEGRFLEFQAIDRDITAHKQAEAAEREQRQLAEALRDSLAALTGSLRVDEVMARILDATATIVPSEAGSIILFEQDQGRVAHARGFTPAATAFFRDYRFPLADLVSDGIVAQAQAYFVPDTQTAINWTALPVSTWIRSSIGVPIVLRGQPIGLLMLDSATPHHFQPTDLDKLQLFAQYASLALENAYHISQLEERVGVRTAELQAAKEQVEAILHSSPDAIFLVAPDLRIRQTNAAFQALIGEQGAGALNGALLDLIEDADAELVTKTVASVLLHNRSQRLEVRALCYDGVRLDAELSIAPLQGAALVCTLRDITKRKVYERHLRFYASLQDNLTDAVITTDLTFHIQSWNRAAELIYGWQADEVIGKPVQEVLLTHFASTTEREEMRQRLLQQGWWQGEIVQRDKDGAFLDILGSVTLFHDEQGTPAGVVAVNHDITERKQAETALRESEEKFRRFVEVAPIPIVITDQQGLIVLVNQQAASLFAYPQQELVGQPLELLVPAPMRQRHQAHRQSYLQSPHVREMGSGLELFARRRDGFNIPVEIQLSYVETTTGLLVMSFIVDITERKRASLALREQRDFLQSVIDNVPATIIVKDRANRLQLANQHFAHLYHSTPAAIIGKAEVEFIGSDAELEALYQRQQTVLATGEPFFIPEEKRFDRYYQSTHIPLQNSSGEYDRILVVATDITARLQAEATLRRSEEKFRQIVASMRGGVVIYDLMEQITYVNERFCELSGYSFAELLGTTSYDLIDPAYVPLLDEQLAHRRQGESTTYEIRGKRKDGQHPTWLIAASPWYDDQHTMIGSIAVVTDISAQKQAEAVLQSMLQKERELSELKSRVVTTASHELRTPLASILACTETLHAYRHKLSDAQIDQRLDVIREQVGFLRTIMDNVLQVERLRTGRGELQRTQVDLDHLCRTVLEEFQAQLDFRHHISYQCDVLPPPLALDKRLMRQILVNLVENALKYSPPATTVYVSLTYTDTKFSISVQDEGIGIPSAELAHLFQPFQRASNVGAIGGTGLGLVIVKEAIQLQNGTITVTSEVGKGATFTVSIPLVDIQ